MGVVTTIEKRCRRCYSCIRSCPAKAIQVKDGQAKVLDERCIGCGNCVRVCSQGAKQIANHADWVSELLEKGGVSLCLAPSFPASFHPASPGQVISAARKLGFAGVYDVAYGAELVSAAYRKLADGKERLISSACPAVVQLIENFFPELIDSLAPIVSPMIATGRFIKDMGLGEVVFAGPCLAKKLEMSDRSVIGAIDAVLTFPELKQLFRQAGIDPSLEPESEFDGPVAGMAGIFPISGGLLKSAGITGDILNEEIIITEGKGRTLGLLKELNQGKVEARIFDLLLCEGCIQGPLIDSELTLYERKNAISRHVCGHKGNNPPPSSIDLFRGFTKLAPAGPLPSEEKIENALREMNKNDRKDELNCGSCGYRTCREMAIAICQGLSEKEMCLAYLIEEMERSDHTIHDTQNQLIHAEKMASLGQMAAGIAHEINNPLGGILIYSHMLLEEAQKEDPIRGDLERIIRETARCKEIVQGLLNFSRQKDNTYVLTNLNQVLASTLMLVSSQSLFHNIELVQRTDPALPDFRCDEGQIGQVLLNLIVNAAEAMAEGGKMTITTGVNEEGWVLIQVEDNGTGIPQSKVGKIFDPFFTTKEVGKGTGLGLAICYGIVKRHKGYIKVSSRSVEDGCEDSGTTFSVFLPVRALL
ncbi:MAG TPA: histidine kinase [Cyanobacteria bacterium UBA8530]|nr:histidine kinase [Cyanobacteria bacterium UBA8530]